MHLPTAHRAAFLLLVLGGGCATAHRVSGYRTADPAGLPDRAAAEQINARGVNYAQQGDYDRAEVEFRRALQVDIRHAPAHNNLGLVLLQRRQWYLAAMEFTFAAQSDPRAVEPRMNLGRLYETVGWEQAAMAEYERVLAINGDDAEAAGRLAWLCGHGDHCRDRRVQLLRRLAAAADDSPWRTWARAELDAETPASAP